MSFDWTRPEWLGLLLLVPVAAVGLLAYARRRRGSLERFAEAGPRGRTQALGAARQGWRGALLLLGLAGVALAIAGPRWGVERVSTPPVQQQIVFAVDVSRSMLAEDAGGSRLDRARLAVRQVMAALPAAEVGLVVFAGEASLVVPLTRDAAALDLYLSTVGPDWISDPSTDLAGAVAVAVDAFGPTPGPGRAVVVLSDGEDHAGDIESAAAAARERGVVAVSVGIGTPEGARIPTGDGWLTSEGELVVTRLDPARLEALARATDGVFVAVTGRGGLEPTIARLSALETGARETGGRTRRADRYRWPLGVALLALAAEAALRLARRRPAVAVLLLAVIVAAGCGERPRELYEDGRYPEALDAWRAADTAPGARPIDAYLRASAAYRLGEFREAAASWAVAARTVDAPTPAAEGWYNAGNARYRRAEELEATDAGASLPLWDAAVGAYRESLLRAPGDADAKHNLELALRQRDQAGGGGGGGGGGGDGQDGGGGGRGMQPPSSGVGDSPRDMSPSEAERLLDALAAREREALAAGRQDPSAGRRQEPGW